MATQAELDHAMGAHEQAREAGTKRAKAAHKAGADATYTVQPSDTLASIAEAVYGDAAVAAELWAVNSAVIGADPANLAPGTSIVLPAL
jgi:nucleoid-associated protein YgaU